MSIIFEKIGSVVAAVALAIGGLFGYVPEQPVVYAPEPIVETSEVLGADTILPVAGITYYLAGTGISSSATSFTLTSFTITQTGMLITDAMMSETFYFTLEPGSRNRQEIVGCTTVTQNADGTATISGCSRGLSPVTPYTASTTYAFAHAGGSVAILSNPPQLYNQVAIKDNDETITGLWDFPEPVAGTNPATKDYVLSVVTGGSISIDSTIIGGLAGENFATGSVVYLKPSDARWYKADADDVSTFSDRQLGIAQSVGTAGDSVIDGVLIYGIDDVTQSAMTPGALQWLSTTAGATTTSTTTQALGVAIDATTINFNPQIIQSAIYTSTTFFNGTTTASSSTAIIGFGSAPSTTVFSTAGVTAYQKNPLARVIVVEVVGGGGGGGNYVDTTDDKYGTGGGGGGYSRETFTSNELSASTTVVVGAGGGAETAGGTSYFGGTTTASALLYATGGGAGGDTSSSAGSGGQGTNGDINIKGGPGDSGASSQAGSAATNAGSGGNSFYGGGGAAGDGISNGESGGSYGGGGAGAHRIGYGPGSGATGVVIITEYI